MTQPFVRIGALNRGVIDLRKRGVNKFIWQSLESLPVGQAILESVLVNRLVEEFKYTTREARVRIGNMMRSKDAQIFSYYYDKDHNRYIAREGSTLQAAEGAPPTSQSVKNAVARQERDTARQAEHEQGNNATGEPHEGAE